MILCDVPDQVKLISDRKVKEQNMVVLGGGAVTD